MINVCPNCYRLNPHEHKYCHYCFGDCQMILASEFGHWLIGQIKAALIKKKAEAQTVDCFPDLGLFEELRTKQGEPNLFLARP